MMGTPKGVVYSHRAMYLHTEMLTAADTWAISSGDAVLPIVPMYHVNAWGLPFAALWWAPGWVLPGRRPDGAALVRLLADATFSAAVPTVGMDVFGELRRTGARLPTCAWLSAAAPRSGWGCSGRQTNLASR